MKTALITGASRGLGLALAQALARDGWGLIINARSADTLEAARAELAAHTQVIAIPGDITDTDHRNALRDAANQLGGLDAIINNAGILGPSPQPNLLDYPLDVLEDVYRTNVIAPLGIIQALQHSLKDNARIVNVTSDAGAEAYPGWGGYGSGKAALEHWSAILATENPTWRIYWVDPGDMQTQMHQDAFPGEDITDRPLPEASVPSFLDLLNGDYASGRYVAQNMHDPRVKGVRFVITAADYADVTQFYRAGLGLKEVTSWDRNGRGVVFNAGVAEIEIIDEPQAVELEALESTGVHQGKLRLAFNVSQLMPMAENVTAQGAKIVREALIVPWGHLNQRFETPDGIPLTLFQEVES